MAKERTLKVRLTGDAKGALGAMGAVEGKAGLLGGALGKLKVVGFAAVAAGVGIAAKSFLDFDDAMKSSLAIMGDVSSEMQGKMKKAALEVGSATTFSATEAAEAYYFLSSAGLNAEQSVAALPQVAKFAQAGLFDLSRATEIAGDAQSALGLKSADAQENLRNMTRVTDVLVKANTLANASVEQFGDALTNKAAGALRIVNKDIEEGVAVLAAFADKGIKGARAGESLSVLLRDLPKAAQANKSEFDALGIAIFDADGRMRNMRDIIGDFEGALGGMTDEQKLATLTQLGFTEASGDAIKTLLGSSEAIGTYESKLRDAGGTTDEVSEKQWSWKKRLVNLKDVVLEDVIPALDEFGRKAEEEWLPKVQSFFDALGGDDEEGGEEGGPFGSLREFAEDAETLFEGLTTALSAIDQAWRQVFGMSLPEMTNSFFTTAQGNWGTQMQLLREIMAAGAAGMRGDWSGMFGHLGNVATLGWSTLTFGARAGIGAYNGLMRFGMDTAVGLWRGGWNLIGVETGKGVGNFIGQVAGLPGRVREIFAGARDWLYDAGLNIIRGLIRGVTDKIGELRSKLREVTNMIPDWKGPLDTDRVLLRPAGRATMAGYIAGIEDEVPRLRDTLEGITSDIGDRTVTADAGGSSRPVVERHYHLNVTGEIAQPIDEAEIMRRLRHMELMAGAG